MATGIMVIAGASFVIMAYQVFCLFTHHKPEKAAKTRC